MKKTFTLFIFIAVLLSMCLITLPTAQAADGDYTYIDETGAAKTTEGLTVTPVTADTGTLNSGWYVVNSNITRSGTITVSGSVNLILMDNFNLTVTGDVKNAGIRVSSGNRLTIYGQAGGTGAIIAQGGQYGAGIGGGYWSSGGALSIYGGTVSATGGEDAAGIGGGKGISGSDNSSGGTIKISGGSVTATGNGYGAGIGGGLHGYGGTITISGGMVNAAGGDSGAGIGGGAGKSGGSINISGGTVIARSIGSGGTTSGSGAGIGGGDYGSGGTIIISGGNVTAGSHYRGAGIGGGDMRDGGSITISGGTINAYSDYGGTGIGGAYLASGGTINIQGGDVTARGGTWGAGIGSGGNYNAGNITISGGVVKAYAGEFAAGIGAGGTNSGSSHNGGTIKILGGKVTAQGGASGMDAGLDIGRGRNGVNGTLLIDDTAQVTLAANGIDTSVTTLGTCILQGSASGSLLGAYENGTKIDGTLIDVSNPALSSGTGYTVSGNTVTLSGSSFVLFGSTVSRNVTVSSGVSTNVTLFAADMRPASGCAFNMAGATVNMRLVRVNTLSSGSGCAGLQAAAGSSLTLSGSGSLTATGGNNGAGIGGGNGLSAGSITFSGGTVEAVGNGGGAGIGGGSGGTGGAVITDGENTTITAVGGTGFDIGSGSGNSAGGSLTIRNNAAVNLNQNGTNANANFITGIVGGGGSGLLAGTYLNSQKLLSLSSLTASPESGAEAFDSVTLTASVSGLSETNPQGQIAFYDGGTKIGQVSLTRSAAGSANATAVFVWSARGGTHMFTAQYAQNETADSYYMTDTGKLENYSVAKIEQAPVIISGVPGKVTYGDAAFILGVSGGSSTGSFNYSVTSGDAVSVSAGGAVTILKAGAAQITVTRAGDSDYLPVSANVSVTVDKATPPAVVFPSAGTLTYEQPLSDSALNGGSGDGSFAWENPTTIPTVLNTGYNVVFTPDDIDNYDYTGFILTKNVSINVKKATPVVTFPTADEITYEQPLSDSVLNGGSGNGSFAWESPDTIPTVVNGGYRVVFTPDDTDNYLIISQIIAISVKRAEQAAPAVIGIPSAVTYGDSPFDLTGSGGSGTGSFSYSVASGDAVSVSTGGTVSVLKAGTAKITATKAGDMNYLPVSVDVAVTVNKAVPMAVFPTADTITYEQPLSASALKGGSGDGSFAWEIPNTIPNVINSGYNVVFTPNDTDNYLTIKQTVALNVSKAAQAPLTINGIPDKITYGDTPFTLNVSGGTAEAALSYTVVSGEAVTVDTSGKVTIAHGGAATIEVTNVGDYNYLPVSKSVVIIVNKAEQPAALSVVVPNTVAYGDSPFRIDAGGGNGSGIFSYQVASGDAVTVDSTGLVTVVRPGTAVITAAKAADDDYLRQEKKVEIRVAKGVQSPLVITGIPQRIIAGHAPFGLAVSGGSGSGAINYAVTSGNAVSVSPYGIVTILKTGKASVTVSKAADDYYTEITIIVEINVRKQAITENAEPSASVSPVISAAPSPAAASSPTAAPSPTVTSGPTAAPRSDVSPSPISSTSSNLLKPLSMLADESTGIIEATINIGDLPEGIASIKLPSGKIVKIGAAQKTLMLQISQADLNGSGELVIFALNAENIPMGNYTIDMAHEAWQEDFSSSIFPTVVWIAAGILVFGIAITAAVIWTVRKNRRR